MHPIPEQAKRPRGSIPHTIGLPWRAALIPSLREDDSPRHREPPLGGVTIQGRAAGVSHAALDRHASLAMTSEWVPVTRTWYYYHYLNSAPK